MTTIDELLDDGPREIVAGAHRSTVGLLRIVAQNVILAVALGAVAWGLMVSIGYDLPYALVFMAFLAVVTGLRLTVALLPFVAPQARLVADVSGPAVTDRPFAEAKAWAERLEGTRGDVERFRWNVLPAVKALVDERLRLRHGVTRYRDPVRSAELLGPRLTEFLAIDTLRRMPTPAELSAMVKELEEL